MSLRDSPTWPDGWERYSVLLVVFVWAVARALQIHYLGWGSGYDVGLYVRYAQQFGGGSAAYAEFQPEYPPGALLVFLVPLLWGGAANYTYAFAAEMACFDLASAVLVFRSVELAQRGAWYRPFLAAFVYIVITAALFPVLYSRFDLVPGALVLGAFYCLQRRRMRTSAVLLGIAGAVKLWPFALVPLWIGVEIRRKGLQRAMGTGLWIGLGAVLAALPVLPRAGWAVLSFLKYHAARGIQIETTWATMALLLQRLGVATVSPEHNFGAFHVAGRVPALFAQISMPLTVVFALVPQVLAIAYGMRKKSEAVIGAAVLGGVLGFMIAGKVLSPQFMLWIAPLLPLAAETALGSGLVIVMAVLTTVVYPYLSPALEQRAPGHGWALAAVGGRNLLLVVWYVLAAYAAIGHKLSQKTAADPCAIPPPLSNQEDQV